MALPDKRLRQKTSASASATDTKGGTREKVEKMKPAKPITKVRKNLKADEAKAKTKKKQEKAGMKEKKDKKEKKADKEKPDKKEKNAEKVKKDKKDNNAEKEKPDKKEKNAEKEKPDKKEKKAEKEKPDKKEKNTEKEKKDKKEKSAEQETQERKKAEEIKGKIETTAAKRKSQDHEVKESKKPKAAPATKEEKKAQKKEQKKAEKKEKKESKRADKAAKIDENKETKDEAETPKRPPAIRYVPVEKKKIKPIFETPVPSPSASTGGTSAGTARTPTSTAMERANDKLKELTSMLESSQSPSEPDDAEMMFGAMIAEQKEEREKEAEENGETSDTTGEEEDDDDDKEDKVAEEEEEDEEPSQEMSDDEYDGEEMTGEELEGLLAQSPVYDPETDEDEEEEEEEEESEDQDDQEEDEEEAEDETKVQDKEDDKDKHALVPVTQATAFGTKLLRNSTTNKREYDTFVRQIKSSGKFPTQLSEFAQTNRLELFNIWMNTGCSWDSCCLEVERLQTTKNQTIRGWRAVQGKELRPKYTEDKFNKLISARRDAGLFYEDQDFPGDIDECWYFMRVGEEIKNKSETADRLKLAASKQVDDTLRQSLTDQDEGILRPGALPKIEGVSASASKALASSFGQVAAPKKKPKEKAEKVEATSAKGEAVQRMETLLKDSAAARTSSITLQSVEYAAELSRQLLQHAEALEGFYQRVKLAVEKDEDESFFKSLMVKIKEKEAFGVKAQAAASAMLRSAKAKAKAKAKPKGRKSKNATAKPADDEK